MFSRKRKPPGEMMFFVFHQAGDRVCINNISNDENANLTF